MDSFGQQAYQGFSRRRSKRSRVAEIFAALLLLLSIMLLLVTGTHALRFRSIIQQGKASKAVEYHIEAVVPAGNTTIGETAIGDNKDNEK